MVYLLAFLEQAARMARVASTALKTRRVSTRGFYMIQNILVQRNQIPEILAVVKRKLLASVLEELR